MQVNPLELPVMTGPTVRQTARREPDDGSAARPRRGETPVEAAAATATRTRRRGRAHVQQALHQLEKVVRNAVREELRSADDLDPRMRREIRELERRFAHDLSEAFHAAGRGRDFDPARLLSGVSEAVVGMTGALRLLLATDEPPAPDEIGGVEIVDREAPPAPDAVPPADPDPAPDRGLLVDLQA
jgi:hypothetical protein